MPKTTGGLDRRGAVGRDELVMVVDGAASDGARSLPVDAVKVVYVTDRSAASTVPSKVLGQVHA